MLLLLFSIQNNYNIFTCTINLSLQVNAKRIQLIFSKVIDFKSHEAGYRITMVCRVDLTKTLPKTYKDHLKI